MKFTVSTQKGRLDKFVHTNISGLSRSFIAKIADDSKIFVNGNPEPAKYKIQKGDHVVLKIDIDKIKKVPIISLPIIFENDDVIVVDKPEGVLTHSKGKFNPEATVASFIEDKIDIPKKKDSASAREGIVHRLDRATSGVIITAKTLDSHKWLKKQFSDRKVKKTYIAIVSGELKHKNAEIDMPIARNPKNPKIFKVSKAGKPSQTVYRTLKSDNKHSKLELKPVTGRTHQLRVHLSHVGNPIVGDELYGGEKNTRMLLHAYKLEITLPSKDRKIFVSKIPKEFSDVFK